MTFLRFTHAKILSNLFTSVFFFSKIKFFIIKDGEITIAERDGAAHVLRCLKVWYDLSNDVLFTAINLVDRFLTKMKVRPKHMSCISVGSLHLATKQLGLDPIDTEDLVAISQVSIDEIFKIYICLFKCENLTLNDVCVMSRLCWREHKTMSDVKRLFFSFAF